MDGVEEEERPDSFVEIVASAAEIVESTALGKQRVDHFAPAQGFQREIAFVRSAGNDVGKAAHEEAPLLLPPSSRSAKSSRICDSTSLR